MLFPLFRNTFGCMIGIDYVGLAHFDGKCYYLNSFKLGLK